MGDTMHSLAFIQDGWGTDHSAPFDWAGNAGLVGAALAAGLFLLLLLRGLAQADRYRATSVLGDTERAELAAKIAEAEESTVGEIVVVVLERSDRHPAAEWMAAGLTLLCGSVLLASWLPWELPAVFFLCQLGLGSIGFLAARMVPGFKRVFVSEGRADEMAREQALQEFYAHGLHRTQASTGVLLFVSLLERRVIVLGDEGIDAKLAASDWEATDNAILGGIRAGSLMRGLDDGIRRSAELLAEHFPSDETDRDEVPNHVIVRKE